MRSSPSVLSGGSTLVRTARPERPAQRQAPAATGPSVPVVPSRERWTSAYRSRLLWSDVAVVGLAVVLAQVVRFGTGSDDAVAGADLSYTALSLVVAGAWVTALAGNRSRDPRVVGSGVEEYRRVVRASFLVFGALAIVAFLVQMGPARGYLAVALPVGLGGLLLERWQWRRWLTRRRLDGQLTSAVVVVGSRRAAEAMAAVFARDPAATYRVEGVCVPGARPGEGGTVEVGDHRVPVLGDEHRVLEALRLTGADTVAVTDTDSLGADGMRDLAWDLVGADVDLVVSPGVVDVAGPRLMIRPVAGLPLLHVEQPQFEGANRVGKLVVDLVGAAGALLVALPVLLAVAVAVKTTSRGPVLYRSERVGLDGTTFSMLKFRSMEVGADQTLELLSGNDGAGPLFKLRQDPRVTAVGRVIRRLSLDELPQLVNVLRGEMSLVGPRPPLPSEVATYEGDVHRRLLVKPGVTGLWQISGRSDLSWDEAVRLDLTYVENWSITADLVIILRTLRAVLTGHGAY